MPCPRFTDCTKQLPCSARPNRALNGCKVVSSFPSRCQSKSLEGKCSYFRMVTG